MVKEKSGRFWEGGRGASEGKDQCRQGKIDRGKKRQVLQKLIKFFKKKTVISKVRRVPFLGRHKFITACEEIIVKGTAVGRKLKKGTGTKKEKAREKANEN